MSAPRDLVVFGTHPFEAAVPLGDWQLARALGRHHRVLWVDPPASPFAPRRGMASAGMFSRRPVPAVGGVVVGSPIVPTGRPVPRFEAVVERLVTAQVNRWTRLLGMNELDAISFASRLGALRGLRRRRLAAWLKDRDWAAVDVGDRKWIHDRQVELVQGADLVTGVSPVLVADCRSLGVDAIHIPNGCDVEAFRQAGPAPAHLIGLPRPWIMFAGAWNERVDVTLVERVARRIPDASIIIVGAVSVAVPAAPNVHVVGAVPYDQLPAHVRAADVGIIPYRTSAFNDASCPLKLYEYLAAGLPVVASGVDVGSLGNTDVVYRRDHPDAFAAAVCALSVRDLRATCTALAADHSWDARAGALLDALDTAAARESPMTMTTVNTTSNDRTVSR